MQAEEGGRRFFIASGFAQFCCSLRIRQALQMTEKTGKQGYLEVSVKHSGSLLLWSGGERFFYSKNSTANVYTAAGEILLRQQFVRAI
jgi:hypothetical protein